MKIFKTHEDNSPLANMNVTRPLLFLIKEVRYGALDLLDEKMVSAAAKACGATPVDIANFRKFFDENNDAYSIIDVPDGGARS